jgi:predicted Zn-dependent peptidase
VRASRLRDLAIQQSQPQPVAQAKFDSVVYGNHPYGRDFPSEAMLGGFTIQQVRDFYRAQFGAQRAHLYVVGVYDAAAVERAARQAFGRWQRGPAPVHNPPAPRAQRSLTVVNRPGAPQSTIIVGLPVAGPTSPDFTKLEVMDALLGGTFGSRITTNIRERKGYTYSPFSQVATEYHTAYWAEQADVTTQYTGPSLKEIFGEIDRLRSEAPPADELNGIKNNVIGLFTLRNASRGGIIGQLAEIDLQGLGPRWLSERVQRILAVTPQDVQQVTQRYLVPDKMAIVVVGDRKVIDEQLAPYGTVTP